jgi:hypothetical protein
MGAAENGVQVACIRYLQRQAGVLTGGRINNSAVYDPKIKEYRAFSEDAVYGVSDSMFWARPGVFPVGTQACIEFKSEKGATSPEQRDFLVAVAGSGQTAMLIRDFHELIAVLEGRVQAEPETGVYIPSGKWHLAPSKSRRHAPQYFKAPRRRR